MTVMTGGVWDVFMGETIVDPMSLDSQPRLLIGEYYIRKLVSAGLSKKAEEERSECDLFHTKTNARENLNARFSLDGQSSPPLSTISRANSYGRLYGLHVELDKAGKRDAASAVPVVHHCTCALDVHLDLVEGENRSNAWEDCGFSRISPSN